MSRQNLSRILLAAAVVLLILAVTTMLPYSSSMISDLGYYTVCPFAPWSTLALLLGAGVTWVLRKYIDGQST